MQDAPCGVTRVFTPGADLLCGLHAVRLSMKYQPSFRFVRQPTIQELLGIWKEVQKARPEGNENNSFFEVTQLARITQTYLAKQGVASRLGVVSPSMELQKIGIKLHELRRLGFHQHPLHRVRL
ncbi:hypothetical protein N0V93_004448 [Gnomoniopsis smithogilvyi]|uniref:Uncharacterized protein n=1 Tax=Gnomoniopsis smithogilvyi TaxID=1191159 RepID=A0A9W8YRI1_9PEZI|nr:hypothetical protein N0V93_004448 [Gnomoniopsis smithogilvyi]